ncbi:hypothetical protein RB195_020430 [Necator americanus]|uniref:Uncharacterized protein n=1 Tax=Necator americanus TaxID=51031 RepID=A0ABR1CMD7_NECAM
MVESEGRSVNSEWDSLSLEETTSLGRPYPIIDIPQIIHTSPSALSINGRGISLGDRLDAFNGQQTYLRVPGHSGRTSPSVASNLSEPESCIDDTRYDDDDVGMGEYLFDFLVY